MIQQQQKQYIAHQKQQDSQAQNELEMLQKRDYNNFESLGRFSNQQKQDENQLKKTIEYSSNH